MATGHCNSAERLRCPNKLSKFSGEIPHSGRPLPKKKLDASRIVGYGSYRPETGRQGQFLARVA
jgi:hypothetical protein